MIDGSGSGANGNAQRAGGGIPISTPTSGVSLFPVPQKYDPDEFIISSTDQKGHNEKFWFRAPGGLERQIQIFMSAKRFPYKTPSDMLRHALVRHLHWLSTLEPEVQSVMGQVQVVLDICREEQYQQDFNDVFDKIDSTVRRYLGAGHQGEALRTVARCKDTFEDMPEGFWRDQYVAELMKRFGYLYEGDGVGLLGPDPGPENG